MTQREWAIMEVLWAHKACALGDVTTALHPTTGWSRSTVITYLTRMEKKGLVTIAKDSEHPYRPALAREVCAQWARSELLHTVYSGAATDLVAAFLKDSHISTSERDRLRTLLDEMEV